MATPAGPSDEGSAAPAARKRQREGGEEEQQEEAAGVVVGDGEAAVSMPVRALFRQRAHCNPLSFNDSFSYPGTPEEMDWSQHYPTLSSPTVDTLDMGCGFGGLTVALAGLFPDSVILGMEIRAKVCEYVAKRIRALRGNHPGSYGNASVLRTNCMRYLPNYFRKGQLQRLFICFPDPHFKAKNHRRRIVSLPLLSEYAFFLRPDGRLYTITDVEEVHQWMVAKCDEHPCFERLPTEGEGGLWETDPSIRAMHDETEEGKKVARNGGSKFIAVYRRLPDHELPPSPLEG